MCVCVCVCVCVCLKRFNTLNKIDKSIYIDNNNNNNNFNGVQIIRNEHYVYMYMLRFS